MAPIQMLDFIECGGFTDGSGNRTCGEDKMARISHAA